MLFLLIVMLMIVSLLGIEIIGIYMNRSIIKNIDMSIEAYMFKIYHTGFSMFLSVMLSSSLAVFSYVFITDFGLINGRSLTAIALFLSYFLELIKKLFLKIKVHDNAISYNSLTKKANFTFDDITKVEVISMICFVFYEVYSKDGKLFTLKYELAGQAILLKRLKDQGVEWKTILGDPLDKTDI